MKTDKDFINASKNVFTNIDTEAWREYIFPGEECIVIENPIKLSVNLKSGGHRIWDAQNISHYIPSGWIQLKWEAQEGKPNFVK